MAKKILHSNAAIEGECKQVTALFDDLKGSTELLDARNPEEARQLLDPVTEHMTAAVPCYEGPSIRSWADGIMALFAAPLAHEGHAVWACYAAVDMQERIKHYATAEHGKAAARVYQSDADYVRQSNPLNMILRVKHSYPLGH